MNETIQKIIEELEPRGIYITKTRIVDVKAILVKYLLINNNVK